MMQRLLAAMQAAPHDPAPARALGLWLSDRNRHGEAATAFVHARLRGADDDAFWFLLGATLQRAGLTIDGAPEALTPAYCYDQALRRNPLNALARANRAHLAKDAGRYALATHEATLALICDPAQAAAWDAFAIAQAMLALDARAGRTAHDRAMSSQPGDPRMVQNAIAAIDNDQDADAAAQAALRRRYGRFYAGARPRYRFNTDRAPDRPLRVGYLSGDFATAIGAAFRDVLAAHDPAAVTVIRYDSVGDQGRAIANLGDEQAATLIGQDRIDVLVDLSGHAGGHRLGVLALRPAPVQVTGFGLPFGVGLSTLDGLLLDAAAAPDALCLLQQRATVVAAMSFAPPAAAPDPGPLPMTAAGRPTIGLFNRPEKISPGFLDLLAELGRRRPDAVFLFKQRLYDLPDVAGAVRQAMMARGLDAARLRFVGRRDDAAAHFAGLAEADIALDPLVYGGGLTTLETLWMGVPVLSHWGNTLPARVSAGILTAAGCGDWVANDAAGIIDLALALLGDPARLAATRAGLRARLTETAPFAPGILARSLEARYRALWRQFLDG